MTTAHMNPPTPKSLPRVIKLPAVVDQTSLSRTTIYRLISQGTFPAPIKLGPNSSGWLASDINEWIMARKVESMQIH
jgi:prophage regulatory protein